MTSRHGYLDYLDETEKRQLDEHNEHIQWLRERIGYHITERNRIVNRGVQRERLAGKKLVV